MPSSSSPIRLDLVYQLLLISRSIHCERRVPNIETEIIGFFHFKEKKETTKNIKGLGGRPITLALCIFPIEVTRELGTVHTVAKTS